jgi:hypothetical protein
MMTEPILKYSLQDFNIVLTSKLIACEFKYLNSLYATKDSCMALDLKCAKSTQQNGAPKVMGRPEE